MSQTDPNLPPDLREVASTLAAEGPRMTDTEFARVRRTAMARATTGSRRSSGPFTRSRVAITSMLAVGALMSTGGAALGVSALSTDLSARAAQYGTTATQTPVQTLTPTQAGPAAQTGSGDVATATAGGESPPATQSEGQGAAQGAVAQAPRQLEAEGRSALPFTGYVAIPLLLMGLALLAAGCVLRRDTRRTHAQT